MPIKWNPSSPQSAHVQDGGDELLVQVHAVEHERDQLLPPPCEEERAGQVDWGQVQRFECVQWLQQSFWVYFHWQTANVQHAQPPEALEREVSAIAELLVILIVVVVVIVIGGGLAQEDVGAAEEAEGHECVAEVVQSAEAPGRQVITARQVELHQILKNEAYELQNHPNERHWRWRAQGWNCSQNKMIQKGVVAATWHYYSAKTNKQAIMVL